MLTKRIIPCLDVKDDVVVKGVQFKDHKVLGNVSELAKRYKDDGADELVFYDITASADGRKVSKEWVDKTAKLLDVPFCVAGGISSVEAARVVLNNGADKVSINSPALENPELISELAEAFGSQCVVVGVDSMEQDGDYYVYKYTGREDTSTSASKLTMEWIKEAQDRGAGEIVLNCMNQDGVGRGYDIKQLRIARSILSIPLIASGGAGSMEDFKEVFEKTDVDGALAAGVFHRNEMTIFELKKYLKINGIEVRL